MSDNLFPKRALTPAASTIVAPALAVLGVVGGLLVAGGALLHGA